MNKYLNDINTNMNNHLENYFSNTDPMLEICKYTLLNGKRIRPSISIDIFKSLKKNDISNYSINISSLAVEYIHTSSLLIDDLPCMDNANTRRNNISNHVKYGESVAQITSVILVALGIDALTKGLEQLDINNMKISLLCFSSLYKILGNNGIAGGQLLDLTFTDDKIKNIYNKPIDLKDMISKKTGALFEISFILGWLFGGGSFDKVDNIKKISEYFSLIYQILDDLEDVSEDKSPKNFVIKYGKEKSIDVCLENISNFKKEMINLEIYSDYFIEIIKYMENKINNYNVNF